MPFHPIQLPRPGAAFLLLLLAWSPVHADMLKDGRPQVGIELEREKASDRSWRADSITLAPGVRWQDGWITMLEFLAEVEREAEAGDDRHHFQGNGGVRLRKEVSLAPQLKGSLRGLVGRAYEGGHFNYAYLEPALEYDAEACEFAIGYRLVRSVDGSRGHDLNKLRLGPSFELGQNQEIELRWARSWDAHTGRHASDAYSVEFVYKY